MKTERSTISTHCGTSSSATSPSLASTLPTRRSSPDTPASSSQWTCIPTSACPTCKPPSINCPRSDRKTSHAGVRRSEPDLPSAPCTKGVQGAAISLILRCFPAPHPTPPADAPCTRLALPWGLLCPLVSPRGNKERGGRTPAPLHKPLWSLYLSSSVPPCPRGRGES